MKKIVIIFFLILPVSFSNAQSFLFHIKYLPSQMYESSVVTNMNMKMSFSGDSTTMKALKDRGMKSPMTMVSESNIDFAVSTGAVQPDSYFPIILYYRKMATKTSVNGTETPATQNPFVGQTIMGKYNTEGKIQIDSISGRQMNEELKSALVKMLSGILNQMQFPDKSLKIGETFEQQVPFNIPVSGVNLEATIKIIYKLKSVENNLASFDMDESMTMDITTEKNGTSLTLKGAGAGEGIMTYDIKQNFSPLRNANLKMNYTMLIGKLTMAASADISSTTTTIIEQPPTVKELQPVH